MSETAERFLGEIGERIAPTRIAALYLFPPLRQGAVETGFAVLALYPDAPAPVAELVAVANADGLPPADAPVAVAAADAETDAPVALARADGEPMERYAIVTARYCATLKGSERGKWEFAMIVEADAPLDTLDSVVRGVQRRMGDDAEPLLLSGDAVRATGLDVPWSTTT